jgi:hypothetical protein
MIPGELFALFSLTLLRSPWWMKQICNVAIRKSTGSHSPLVHISIAIFYHSVIYRNLLQQSFEHRYCTCSSFELLQLPLCSETLLRAADDFQV